MSRSRLLIVATVCALSLLAGSLVLASSAASHGGRADSCIAMTPAQQRAQAEIIFNGVALDGATATGIERFRALRYLKGKGPKIVRLITGRKSEPGGVSVITSVSIDSSPGETWRIYARSAGPGLFQTNVCLGSRRLR